MEYLEGVLSLVANAAILIFEFMGVGIIIYSGFTGFARFLRKSPETKIYLAKGLAMGLEFKMGSEILRTVVVCANGKKSELSPALLLCGLPSRS